MKLFLVKYSNKRICCVSNNPEAVNPFLTIQTKTWMSLFFVDGPKIPVWSVLSLGCCCFKIYTNHIILKCKSVKMINIPWFLVPHFYLLSVQSYKRLKLSALKEWLFRKTNGKQILVVRLNTFTNVLMFIYKMPISPLWAAQKWLFHSAYFCDCGIKNEFCGINFCDVGIL